MKVEPKRMRIRPWLVQRSLLAVSGCVVYSEWVSFLHWLTPEAAALFWAAACAFLLWDLRRRFPEFADRVRHHGRSLDGASRVLLGLLAVLLVSTFLSAVLSVPSSYDAMTYHLPRQIRWIQQQGLDHFPAHVGHQLHRAPLAEILGAHTLLVTGTDRFVGLVSFGSLIVGLVAVSLIAAEFGCRLRTQLFGCLVVVTYPVAYLQSSSPKVDLVFAAWMAVGAWLGLRIARGHPLSWRGGLALGAAFGLATLAKAVTLLMALPLVAWIVFHLLKRPLRTSLPLILCAVVAFLALTTGHHWRNYQWFGTPFLPADQRVTHFMESASPEMIASRMFKEAALHLAVPFRRVNEAVETLIRTGYGRLGLDLDDSRITVPERPFMVVWVPDNEYQASAPVHLGLAILLTVCALILLRRPREPGLTAVLWMPMLVALTVVLALKWSGYLNPRLHLPVVMLMGAAGAVALDRLRREQWVLVLALPLFLQLIPTLQYSPRSLTGEVFRPQNVQLFSGGPEDFRAPFEQAAEFVNSLEPASVGLLPNGYWGFEYPMMRLLRRSLGTPRFVSFNAVPPPDAGPPSGLYRSPDVVVSYSPRNRLVDRMTGREYVAAAAFEDIRVLVRSDQTPGD